MLYGNYCYNFIENIPQKFSPCIFMRLQMLPRENILTGTELLYTYTGAGSSISNAKNWDGREQSAKRQ